MAEGPILKEKKPKGFYSKMSDKEIRKHVNKIIEENDIRNPRGLEMAYPGLHKSLKRRKLLHSISFEERKKKWGSDEGILEFARKYIEKDRIADPETLRKSHSSLYKVLWNRGLMGSIDFERKKKHREWRSAGSILEAARKLIRSNNIRNRSALQDEDSGLYAALLRHGLMDSLEFAKIKRKWGSDQEVLGIAQRLIEETGIVSIKGLKETDNGLYQVLQTRRLIDVVFSPIRERKESEEQRKGLLEIAEALEELGGRG